MILYTHFVYLLTPWYDHFITKQFDPEILLSPDLVKRNEVDKKN
jgi:hypothetical protein